jgi:hypothetical protein
MTEYSENNPGPLGLRGVEIMTAFIDDANSNEFMFDLFEKIAAEEGTAGVLRTVMGLWHVSSYLLVRLAKATSSTERELLQQMAQYYAVQ